MAEEGEGSNWVEALATGSRFVSEKQLEEERQQYGGSVRAAPAEPAKPLWEQLRANKDRAEEDFKELIRFRPPKALDEDDVTFLAEYELTRQNRRMEQQQAERDELARFEAERAKLVYAAEEPAPIVLPTSPTLSSRSSSSTTKPSAVQNKKKTGLLGVSVIQVAKRKQPDAGEGKTKVTTTTTVVKQETVVSKKPKLEEKEKTDAGSNASGADDDEDDDEGGGLKLVDY